MFVHGSQKLLGHLALGYIWIIKGLRLSRVG